MPSGGQSKNSSAAALKREIKTKLMAWVSEKVGMPITNCDRR